MKIKYCQYCGGDTEDRIPTGDDHVRAICTQCYAIHYQNPKIITGVIVEHNGQILLANRAIEPRYGTWTIPAGFMELNETAQAGAARECYEETEAKLKIIIHSLIHKFILFFELNFPKDILYPPLKV